jgi:CheR methyltransferase, SAM binding domain
MAALRHSATAAAFATPSSDAAAREFAFSDSDFQRIMIYFDGPTKTKLVERFTWQLKPMGFLYIGHSESLVGSHPGIALVGRTTYRRMP